MYVPKYKREQYQREKESRYDYNEELELYYYDRIRMRKIALYYIEVIGYNPKRAAAKARDILKKEKGKNKNA